jgi:hypothetical protein
MVESQNGHPDPLTLQALGYACGDLEAAEAIAFESRLADDQHARDALVAAVRLLAPVTHGRDLRPNAGYRLAVRRRLRPTVSVTPLPASSFVKKGSPLFWALAGAAAASVVLWQVGPSWWCPPACKPCDKHAAPVSVLPVPERSPGVVATEVIYSELSNNERLEKIRLMVPPPKLVDDEPKWHRPLLDGLRPPPASGTPM